MRRHSCIGRRKLRRSTMLLVCERQQYHNRVATISSQIKHRVVKANKSIIFYSSNALNKNGHLRCKEVQSCTCLETVPCFVASSSIETWDAAFVPSHINTCREDNFQMSRRSARTSLSWCFGGPILRILCSPIVLPFQSLSSSLTCGSHPSASLKPWHVTRSASNVWPSHKMSTIATSLSYFIIR